MKKRVLVTGGAGFIGSNIADAYIDAGYDVCIVDDLSSGSKKNLPQKALFYKIDIKEKKLESIFKKFEPHIVNHHAAQIDVRKSVLDPKFDGMTNIIGTINLLQLSVKYRVNKFIFASTGGAIYGEQERFPADESHPTNPLSPYGVSKLCAENYIKYFNIQHKLPFVSLRYSNVYGPRQNPHGEAGVVAIFIQKLLEGKTPVINGDGKQTRDFVFVYDVVSANIMATESNFSGVLNIGTGIETDIITIYKTISSAMNIDTPPVFGPAKPGEQRRSSILSRKAKEELGWEPKYSLEKGIKETVSYFLNQKNERTDTSKH